jgi:hypothetical protein
MTTNLYNYNFGDYKDRYTRDSKWVKLLFNHGRPLQSTELIEMQSVLQDFLKQGLDTLFANGTVLYGLKFDLLSSTTIESQFTLSSGKFYIDGLIIDVESQSITVSNEEEFTLGLSITPVIITEEDEPTLRDPVKGGAVYGLPGASRLIWNTTLVVNDPAAFTLAKVVNGGLIQKDTNIYSKIDDSLAKYTYDRNGHFCLPGGLEVSVLENSDRAITDVSKYQALTESTTVAVNDTQSAYANVLNAKNSVDSLTSQVNNFKTTYNTNPTNSNLITLQDLEARLVATTATYNDLARLYTTKKLLSDKAEQSLASSKALLSDKVYLSISPGVAYVEGYRKEFTTPTVLEVPKSLETSKVTGAIFTYSGEQASTLRIFNLVENSLWADVVSQNTLLTINFNKLLYNQQFVDIKLVLPVVTLTSLNELLTYIVTEVNKPISSNLTLIAISSTTISLTTNQLRTLLKNNLIVEKIGSAIRFASTTLNEITNQITVSIALKERDKNDLVIGDSEVLLVDVNESNLSGAGNSNSFQLGFRPVSEVISVVAELAENNKPIVRGVIAGTSDNLGDDSIFKITKVYQGDTIYVEGDDYQLINQSQIDWSLATLDAKEPSPGTTYYVSFLYTQPLAKGTDYSLNTTTDSIEFINTAPAPNQKFYVDYSYYLSKSGIITLNKEGRFNFILSSNLEIPTVATNVLPLASFKLYANSTEVTSTDCKIILPSEIQSLVEQVKRATCEIENQKLDVAAQLNASTELVTPKGYYNTSLQDLSKIDLNHSLTTGAISATTQSLTGGYTHKDVSLKYISGGTVSTNEFGDNYFVTLPYSNSVLLSQNRATKSRVINQSANINKRAKILAYPQLSFLNEPYSKFTSCDPLTQITSLLTRLSENKPLLLQSISDNNQILFKNIGDKLYKSFTEGNPLTNFIQGTVSFLGYISNLVKSKPVVIKVKVEGLPANSEGYKVYLAGVEIKNYTLLNSTPLSATYPGTIKAKVDGTVTISFSLPEGISFGSHVLELISISTTSKGYAKTQIGVYNNLLTQVVLSALENWDISFNKPIADNFLFKTKPTYFESQAFKSSSSIVNPGSIPDLAYVNLTNEQQYPLLFDAAYQTFKVYDYQYLTQVKIKLKSVDVNEKLVVNLGEADLVNKAPNRSYYASAYATTYNPTNDSSVWTTFTFTYPILVNSNKLYNLSLTSKGSGYEVFTAEVAGEDLLTGGLVGDQLYLDGELFYSEDGKGLNRLEREDLTYQIDKATFTITNEVTVILGSYGNSDNLSSVTAFCLNTRDITSTDTFIQYQYQLVGSTTWNNFDSNKLICLETNPVSLSIRAKLSSIRNNISPALLLQGASVSLYRGNETSTLVSNKITYNQLYKDVYVVLDYKQPIGTSILVYYSPTDGLISQGQEWFELAKDVATDKFIDTGLQVKQATWKLTNNTFYLSNAEGRNKFRFRVDFTTTNRAVQPNIFNVKSYVV